MRKNRPDKGPGRFTIYGKQPVTEAIESGWPVHEVIIRRGADQESGSSTASKARSLGIAVSYMAERDFDAAYDKAAQGVAAVVGEVTFKELDDVMDGIAPGSFPLFVALDGILDPQNLGSICRTCHSMGVHGMVVPRRRTAPFGEGAFKASSGAIFYQPICEVPNIHYFIQWCQKTGIWVYGLDAGGTRCLWEVDLKGPLALVVGSEGKGLSRLVRDRCDEIISIPMFGEINSLNASVACGMALYEAQRQRHVEC
ncbi:MAG: 23S rRNA (guanosine(2251)-2'-O)-methyltransferase RlmB [Firmicutes bacterium]|nr:23S rRNA (guanosine(2251)-2'-O)-methyltransferase RlmB [Candidatus Fermentithermobacillaceae bacterium]